MMMSRATASIVMALACTLALPAAAQPATSGAPPKGAARIYTLEIEGKSGVLLGAQGLAASPAAAGVPADLKPRISELTLTAATGLPERFYEWLAVGLTGKPMPFEPTLRAVDTSGRTGETIALSNPRLISLTFSALDKASHASMHMDVRMQAALKVEPDKAPKLPKGDAHAAATRWPVSGYRLTLGNLDTANVQHIGVITLAPGTGAQLEVTMTGATAQAFSRIAPTPRHKAAIPIDDGQLELLGSDGNVLVTMVLQGVQVTSLYYAPPPATGAPRPGVVGIVANRVDLKFAPGMAR